ncbi:MAG: L,D-transpeptidase [Chloroflexota bacterium]|nr:L,D-transpeptidase [Chloroflexota bacterium]
MNTLTRSLLLIIIICIALVIAFSSAFAGEGDAPSDDNVLCIPGAYVNVATDCQLSGPSQYLTELAEHGFSFPVESLPGKGPDINLTYVEYSYAIMRMERTPVYGSMEAALEGKEKNAARYINAPFAYVSYNDDIVIDGKRIYQIEENAWMTANDVIRITPPRFQGLTFEHTPVHPFAWVLSYLSATTYVETKRTPSRNSEDYTGHQLDNYEIVWIYDTVESDGVQWYMVGPDEWLPQNLIARVIPNTTPPEGVPGGRWIELNLFEQTLAVYDNYELVFATLVASGLDPLWTRPGLFQIYEMYAATIMDGVSVAALSSDYYLEDVPWTMYFDGSRALHGAYWRANLGLPQSHGCVNLSVGDAHWIYDWVELGDWIYVWDPSGETPTDAESYK